jgi:SAM-dependent methyltransferase
MNTVDPGPALLDAIGWPVERARYEGLKSFLDTYRWVFEGKRVLDFGANYGLTAALLTELGAAKVVGVEPNSLRVEKGRAVLEQLHLTERIQLLHVADTKHLPFDDGTFDFVLANAVFEHIAQPRDDYLREVWRLVKVGGYFLVNETPNKYLPVDYHTTKLALVPWLPSALAHRYAVARGRFDSKRTDWSSSGWRGMGYWEFVHALSGEFEIISERSRLRHRVLRGLGLPASLLDPYPTYLVLKVKLSP